MLVGESEHFRLFVDPDLDPTSLPAYMQGPDGLTALETDWSDKQTMLRMPDGKINYHLLTPEHILAACRFTEFSADAQVGCEQSDLLEIDAGYLPHQHELIHAYMALLSPNGSQISFIAEGAAQALGCDVSEGTSFSYDVPWQRAVLEVPMTMLNDDYIEGGLFARYLIRTQGIDAYVRYYQQAPELRDPALFGANFSAYWNMSLDDVWAAMHLAPAGSATTDETICPCSLPALVDDGQPIGNNPVTSPYWTLPDVAGASIGFETPVDEEVLVQDCQGIKPDVQSDGNGNMLVARLTSSDGLYVRAPVRTATVGQYISDTCEAAAPYQLPSDFLSGQGVLSVVANRTSTGSMTEYLQIQLPSAANVSFGQFTEVCDTCAFDQGSCQPTAAGGSPATKAVQGSFYVKMTFLPPGQGDPNPSVVTAALAFTN